jgi:hypothetical protein
VGQQVCDTGASGVVCSESSRSGSVVDMADGVEAAVLNRAARRCVLALDRVGRWSGRGGRSRRPSGVEW